MAFFAFDGGGGRVVGGGVFVGWDGGKVVGDGGLSGGPCGFDLAGVVGGCGAGPCEDGVKVAGGGVEVVPVFDHSFGEECFASNGPGGGENLPLVDCAGGDGL